MNSIPASAIVTINPGVISAGGTPLTLNGLLLTTSSRIPIGDVLSIPSLTGVINYFGADSDEANQAAVYFNGFDNSSVKPASMLFAQYPLTDVAGWMRGGDVSGLTLTQLQAITGTVIVDIDGVTQTSSSINLSTATSFSLAASIINKALAVAGPTEAVFTGSIAGTTLTVSATSSGIIEVGQVLSGTGVTADTYIVARGTGVGGTGTYTVSPTQTASSTTITAKAPIVTYDSVSGGFLLTSPTTGADSSVGFATGTASTALKLTSATGAQVSAGADATTPSAFMSALVQTTQNWASFATAWEPIVATKLAFAAWNNGQNERFLYCMGETDVVATQANPTGTAGYDIEANDYSGTAMLWQPSETYLPAFVMGCVASVDFTQTEGRATLAFRSQSGLTVGVRDQTIAEQLLANGYSYYGAYATSADGFNFLYNGQVSGQYLWIDSYINEIWLNAALQQALLSLLVSVRSVPYNTAGYTLIRQACADPIQAGLNFGAIRPDVPLSASQIAQVNQAAGIKIDGPLATTGWYLQVKAATPQQRALRASPPITLWYMDGQSVQSINMSSILIQ